MTQADIERIHRFVDAWPHPAAVVGALAIRLRVQPCVPASFDLVVVVPPPRRALLPVLERVGYRCEANDIKDCLDGGLVPAESADGGPRLYVTVADAPFLEAVARRATPVTVGAVSVPVATLEDLLLLTLETSRALDLDDALAIRDSHGGGLDRDYLAKWGPALSVDALRFLDGPREIPA